MDTIKKLFCSLGMTAGLAGCSATAAPQPNSTAVCSASDTHIWVSAPDRNDGVMLMGNIDKISGNTMLASSFQGNAGFAADRNGVTMLPHLPNDHSKLKVVIDPKGQIASCALNTDGQTTFFTPGSYAP
ncbi:MAG: hypothetical protein V4621_03385 [Pseudomonadota bacterium]